MNAKTNHDATAHDADGLWQSIQNTGRHGEWVKTAKAIAAAMRNQEKRIRELDAENTVLYAAILEASGLENGARLRCVVELQRIARKDAARDGYIVEAQS